MVELITPTLHSHKINARKSNVQNFKTVVQPQVELQSCKVEILVASIRPLFTNPVTNVNTPNHWHTAVSYCTFVL